MSCVQTSLVASARIELLSTLNHTGQLGTSMSIVKALMTENSFLPIQRVGTPWAIVSIPLLSGQLMLPEGQAVTSPVPAPQ